MMSAPHHATLRLERAPTSGRCLARTRGFAAHARPRRPPSDRVRGRQAQDHVLRDVLLRLPLPVQPRTRWLGRRRRRAAQQGDAALETRGRHGGARLLAAPPRDVSRLDAGRAAHVAVHTRLSQARTRGVCRHGPWSECGEQSQGRCRANAQIHEQLSVLGRNYNRNVSAQNNALMRQAVLPSHLLRFSVDNAYNQEKHLLTYDPLRAQRQARRYDSRKAMGLSRVPMGRRDTPF